MASAVRSGCSWILNVVIDKVESWIRICSVIVRLLFYGKRWLRVRREDDLHFAKTLKGKVGMMMRWKSCWWESEREREREIGWLRRQLPSLHYHSFPYHKKDIYKIATLSTPLFQPSFLFFTKEKHWNFNIF